MSAICATYPRDPARPGTSDILVASAVGRGVWTVANARAQLMQHSQVTLSGSGGIGTPGGDDTWAISRDRNQPWNVVVVERLAGGTPTTLAPFQLSSVEKIQINGFDGDDTVILDIANGPISADTGPIKAARIDFDGGDNNLQDHLRIIGPNAVDNSFATGANDSGASRIRASDRFGSLTTQLLSWSGVEDAQNLVGKASKTQVQSVGLLLSGKWAAGVLNKAFPALGPSLKTWASNQHRQQARGVWNSGRVPRRPRKRTSSPTMENRFSCASSRPDSADSAWTKCPTTGRSIRRKRCGLRSTASTRYPTTSRSPTRPERRPSTCRSSSR